MDFSTINQAFIRGDSVLQDYHPNITIFGSARLKKESDECKDAYYLAKQLADGGYNIITGGGPGIMEAANKGAFAGKGKSIGITITLPQEQDTNPYLDVCIPTEHFFVRKVLLMRYSRCFVCFPGGFGTLDELFEILNLMQTGKIPTVPIYLIGVEYWHHLSRFVHTMKEKHLINTQKYFRIFDSADEVLEDMKCELRLE